MRPDRDWCREVSVTADYKNVPFPVTIPRCSFVIDVVSMRLTAVSFRQSHFAMLHADHIGVCQLTAGVQPFVFA